MEISIPITTLLTSALAIWLLVVTAVVIKGRQSLSVSTGDGGDKIFNRRIRAHANLVEYAPIFVILIGVSELQGGNAIVISILAVAFFLGRLAHGYAFAFTDKNMKMRVRGMMMTLLSIAAIALYNLTLLFI